MREYPILFSTEMVKAILDGRKTQTRRVVKPQPSGGDTIIPCGAGFMVGRLRDSENAWRDIKCPYGQAGGRLWVRETFLDYSNSEGSGVLYKTDNIKHDVSWKPSIHMPRKLSRLTLEITNIRVERVQDIDGDGARAEGVKGEDRYALPPLDYLTPFSKLWDSINAKRKGCSWDDNPFVWCISFKKNQ